MSRGALLAVLCVPAGLLAGAAGTDPRLLLVPVAAIGLVAMAVEPAFAVFVLAVVEVTRAPLVLEEVHGVPSLLVPLSVFLLAVGLLRWPPWSPLVPVLAPPLVVLGAYGLVRLVGVLYADHPAVVWAGTQAYVKDVLAVIALVVLIRTGAHLRAAVWGVVVAGLALGAINVFQHLSATYDTTWFGFARPDFGDVVGTDRFRIGGPVADPNFFAQTMVVATAFALDRLWHERARALRVVAAVAAAVGGLTVLFTNSRGGWLGLGAVVVVLAWRARPRPSTLLAFAIVVAVVVAMAPARYRDSFRSLADPALGQSEVDSSVALRQDELRIGVEMFVDHPVVGVGWRHYPLHYLDYATRLDISTTREERATHNVPLEVAAESGLVGLIAFGAIPVAALAATVRTRRRLAGDRDADDRALAGGVQVAFVGFLVTALFLSLSSPQVYWLLVGLAFAVRSLGSTESHEDRRTTVPAAL